METGGALVPTSAPPVSTVTSENYLDIDPSKKAMLIINKKMSVIDTVYYYCYHRFPDTRRLMHRNLGVLVLIYCNIN